MKTLEYKDDAILVKVKLNEYGDPELEEQADIKTLFRFGMSTMQNDFVANISTDAHAYLDIENPFVRNNLYRLEGMYLIMDRYGEPIWYKIEKSVIGRTLLTDNVDNNVHVWLSKSAALLDINESS